MGDLLRQVLALFGYQLIYVCEWGTYTHRYDDIDGTMSRPVHRHMSVAPPWAKARIVRRAGNG